MPGTVTISIEVELGWGMQNKTEYGHLSSDASAEREALYFLLEKSNIYDIPISFNVVGHLLHDLCSGHHRGRYPDDWWSEDPATDFETDPLFYAPGLIKDIVTSKVSHEVCTHTYSHILCEQTPDQLLDHELETIKRLYAQKGYSAPVSIVTSRH